MFRNKLFYPLLTSGIAFLLQRTFNFALRFLQNLFIFKVKNIRNKAPLILLFLSLHITATPTWQKRKK